MSPTSQQPSGNHPPSTSLIQLGEKDARPLLESGDIIGGFQIRWGSNHTFLVHINAGPGKYLLAVYKPRDGERPLQDFPNGTLYRREYGAFLLSRTLGWPNVPLTLIRNGPYGIGSIQHYINFDPNITYFDLVGDYTEVLQHVAIFDLLTNNADRKASHCILGDNGHVWSIDHGLTFHSTFKVRSVMLEFWGKDIPKPLLSDIERLLIQMQSLSPIASELEDVLAPIEIKALKKRLQLILQNPTLPQLNPYQNVPWPWI